MLRNTIDFTGLARIDAVQIDHLYRNALRLIQEHAGDGTTINEILQSLRVSRPTLRRHFLEKLGRTPGQELMRLRVERAKDLLTNTDFSIKSIAFMSGYRRVSNFGDFFRRQVGLSPRAFRQRKHGGTKRALPDATGHESLEKHPTPSTSRKMHRSRNKVGSESGC
jgi:AraC-like DNA-binding protein